MGRKSKEHQVPAAEGTSVVSAIPLQNLPPASLGGLGAAATAGVGQGDYGAALPGGSGSLRESQTPTLQVVLKDDDQREVAGGQRAQDAAGTERWGAGTEQGPGGPAGCHPSMGRLQARGNAAVPGVLLEANFPGHGQREDDQGTERREGEALIHEPRGALAQRAGRVQRVAHCGDTAAPSAAGGACLPSAPSSSRFSSWSPTTLSRATAIMKRLRRKQSSQSLPAAGPHTARTTPW